MNSRNQYIKNQYLLKYDLIAKYNQKSSKSIPKLNKIKLVLPIKDKSITNFQNKIFLLFYFFSSYKPVITVKKHQSLKDKKMVSNYLLSICFFSKKDIDTFLFSFFIENFFLLEKENFNLFNSNDKNFLIKKNNQQIVAFNKSLPYTLFGELENLLNNMFPNMLVKDLNLNLNLNFTKPKNLNLKNRDYFFKNSLFFWTAK